MKGKLAARALAAQVQANRSGIGHQQSFAGHRARLTAEIAARAPAGGAGRVVLLGAGNANDVDLAALAAAYAEIHLVDVDGDALERARARQSDAVRARIHLHPAVDVSGIWERLDAWSRHPPTPDRMAAEVSQAVLRVVLEILGPGAPAPGGAARSGAPFDTVVSCCLLTQLQLVLVDALGDRHPAFELLRAAVSATHVRVLAGLVAPGGTALLCTDLASSETYPLLQGLPPDADLARLMSDLVHAGNIIYVAHPGLLSAEIRRDPGLSAELAVRFPIGPWLWQNGPELLFLVYALEITRKPAASGLPLPSATSAQEQT